MNNNNNNTQEVKSADMSASKDMEQKKANALLGAYIMLSIDIKSNFELYSYRIITPEHFRERVDEIINDLNELNART
jgi:hypothetical protein